MRRPSLVISAGEELFASFFSSRQQQVLGQRFHWQRHGTTELTADFRRSLATAEALVTTWDSPQFSDDLTRIAPQLGMIAHCGGEVKSRFSRSLFKRLTITNAAAPMVRATAELGAALLLYCARNVDFYRSELRKRSNRIYEEVHLSGSSESVVGKTVAMIGFGRIGRALVDLLRGFDIPWLVHDPYASRSLSSSYPVRFVGLQRLLPQAHLLVLTAALTEQTRGLLARQNLAQLPDNAAIINIARGGLIDLDALRKEVRKGRLRCALDVTDPQEPLPAGDPLRTMPGAILTPHIAGSGRRVREEIAGVVLDDLERFFSGKRVENRVTTSMLDRMT
ncbi:MAG TPA: NAD(P)-dependent oxidoreductase [Candidatus Sulfotelmatobacter sp.]|nr:NAD(P)-dependent oxidoreductase [Candidatus Sulfotelmatobacter sp.]